MCFTACAQNCRECQIYGAGKCDICNDGYGFNSAHTSCIRTSSLDIFIYTWLSNKHFSLSVFLSEHIFYGGAENAGTENAGPENAGSENAGPYRIATSLCCVCMAKLTVTSSKGIGVILSWFFNEYAAIRDIFAYRRFTCIPLQCLNKTLACLLC